jgi:hypothetical protein
MQLLKFMLCMQATLFITVITFSQQKATEPCSADTSVRVSGKTISNTRQLVMNKPVAKNTNGYVERITLSVKNATFKRIYQMVRTRTSYGLIIDQDLIKIAHKTDIDLNKGTITDFLRIISSKFPLEYSIKNKVIFIKFKSPFFTTLSTIFENPRFRVYPKQQV